MTCELRRITTETERFHAEALCKEAGAIDDSYREQDGTIWLGAFEADRMIGAVAFRPRTEEMVIAALAVTSSHRSAGIGRRLISAVKTAARERRLDTVGAVKRSDSRAIAFYVREGCGVSEASGVPRHKAESSQYQEFRFKFDE